MLLLLLSIIFNAAVDISHFYLSTRVPYGEQKEKFAYPTTLVFCQCIVNAIFAYGSKYSQSILTTHDCY